MINKSDVTKLKTGMEQTKSDNFNLISNYMKSKAIKDYLNTYVDDVIKFKLHRNETFILESQDFAFDDLASKIFSSISKSLPTPNYSDNNNVNVRIAIDYRDEYLQFITEEVYASISKIMLFSILIFIVLGIMHIYTGVMMWASSLLLVCAAFTKCQYTAYLYSVNNVIRKL